MTLRSRLFNDLCGIEQDLHLVLPPELLRIVTDYAEPTIGDRVVKQWALDSDKSPVDAIIVLDSGDDRSRLYVVLPNDRRVCVFDRDTGADLGRFLFPSQNCLKCVVVRSDQLWMVDYVNRPVLQVYHVVTDKSGYFIPSVLQYKFQFTTSDLDHPFAYPCVIWAHGDHIFVTDICENVIQVRSPVDGHWLRDVVLGVPPRESKRCLKCLQLVCRCATGLKFGFTEWNTGREVTGTIDWVHVAEPYLYVKFKRYSVTVDVYLLCDHTWHHSLDLSPSQIGDVDTYDYSLTVDGAYVYVMRRYSHARGIRSNQGSGFVYRHVDGTPIGILAPHLPVASMSQTRHPLNCRS